MEIVTAIALILAVAALVVAGIALRQAREARSIAEQSKPSQRDLTPPAPRSGVEPATALVAASVPMSSPPHAPRDVALHHDRASANEPETGGAIVVRPGSTAGQELPTNQGTGSGLIGVFLYNQGPATAHDLQLIATFPTGVIRRSSPHHTLSARKEGTLFVQIVPQDFGPDDGVDVAYCIRYRDVHGDHELHQPVRVQGGWKGPWATYVHGLPVQGTGPGADPAATDTLAN